MTIRAKLTLWYAAILAASLLLILGLAYQEFVVESREPRVDSSEPVEAFVPRKAYGEVTDIILVFALPAALIGLAGGWWLTRQALAPVAALTRAVEQIHERNLHAQLPRRGNGDELDRLTEVFNAMTTRLDQSFQRIREFTLHASHELKTPLTVLRGETESALHDETLSPAARERLASQLDELERLAKIVDGLTLLTKADAGQVALQREIVRLDELVQDARADAEVLAQPHRIRVRVTVCEPLTVMGDRHRLRQVLLNLTDNAVKYNQPDGEVTLALQQRGDLAELVISNTGPGVATGEEARVFERFYRGDASHNQAVEGCGLGLSLAQWIVHAHGGSIALASPRPGLTAVTVTVPARTA